MLRALIIILAAVVVLAINAIAPAPAEANKITNQSCHINAVKKTQAFYPQTRRQWNIRYNSRYWACYRFGVRHNAAHRRIFRQYAFRCSRMSSGATYRRCYQLGQSSMPLSWTVDPSLHTLLMKESGFNFNAVNPSSEACGIGQRLVKRSQSPGRGCPWRVTRHSKYVWTVHHPPVAQGSNVHRYIVHRYGSPAAALNFHYRNNWY